MPDQQPESIEVKTDECSTNFYFSIGKEEVFNCQLTIRGNPTPAKLQAHIRSAVAGMEAIVKSGGHARQGKSDSAGAQSSPSQGNGSAYNFKQGKGGKTFVVLGKDQAEPNKIPCPNHDGKELKRQTNERGAWYSHKQDDGYCSVSIEHGG